MKFCIQCGSNTDNDVQQCSRCYTNVDKYYSGSLSDVKAKRGNILTARDSFIQGDYSSSVRLLSEIAIKEPKNINILFQLGRSLSGTKDFSRAMQVYERALKIKPDSVNILFAKGLCYKELGDLKEAKKYFIRCMELEPVFKNARQMMKICEDELDKEHDDIVRNQMKDIFKARPKKEGEPVREEIGRGDFEKTGKDIEHTESYRCSSCGDLVLFEDQYQMWWCDTCSRYIEEDMLRPDTGEYQDEEQEYTCERCNKPLTFVEDYQRWWCDGCRKYLHEEGEDRLEQDSPVKETRDFSPDVIYCDTCEKAMRFIDQYQMWWCDVCEKYLGEEGEGEVIPPRRGGHAKQPASSIDTRGHGRSPQAQTGYAERPDEHQHQGHHGPRGASAPPTYPCKKCGAILKFIDQYQRWWCDSCYEYI